MRTNRSTTENYRSITVHSIIKRLGRVVRIYRRYQRGSSTLCTRNVLRSSTMESYRRYEIFSRYEIFEILSNIRLPEGLWVSTEGTREVLVFFLPEMLWEPTKVPWKITKVPRCSDILDVPEELWRFTEYTRKVLVPVFQKCIGNQQKFHKNLQKLQKISEISDVTKELWESEEIS